MKFREQGKKVQVLAYTGYDNVKKKSIVQMVATYDPKTLEVSYVTEEDGKERANSVMKNEITEHLESIKRQQIIDEGNAHFKNAVHALKNCGHLIEKVSNISDQFFEAGKKDSEEEIASIWRALQSLEKVLEANGHPRPKRQYKKPADLQIDPRQVDLLGKS